MKKKGFTLIELLAVIVIVGIILLISVPLIGGVIEDAKKGAALSSAKGIYNSAIFTYSNYMLEEEPVDLVFTFTDGVISSNELGVSLKVSKTNDYNGFVRINTFGKVQMTLSDGKFCINKVYNNNEYVIEEKNNEECLSTTENPEIELVGLENFKIALNYEYEEIGYNAYDLVDGDISNQVAITSNLDNTTLGDYQIIYSVVDTEGNTTQKTRNIEVVDIDRETSGRYIIVDVNDYFGGNSGAINEIEVYDKNNVELPYTYNVVYDSATNNVPYYWNGTVWNKTGLDDNDYTYSTGYGAALLMYSSAFPSGKPGQGLWTRFVLDLGETKEVGNVSIYAGNTALRFPRSVSAYVTDNYEYESNIKSRENTNLTLIDEVEFYESDTTNVRRDALSKIYTLDIIENSSETTLGSLPVYVSALSDVAITTLKWAEGNRTPNYFTNSGNVVKNNSEFLVSKNGTYTVYFENEIGVQILKTIDINNIDEAPDLTLNGNEFITLIVGDTYNELGATAFDTVDNENVDVSITGSVDTNTEGIYEVTYSATDSNGSTSTVKRTITVLGALYDFSIYNNVYYVSETGNDTSGNGTFASPYKTLNHVYSEASSGDAIYIIGNINLSTALTLTKNIDFYGDYISDASTITMTNYRMFRTVPSVTSKFYGIYFDSASIYEIFDGYYGTYVDKGNLEFYNCVIKNMSTGRNVFIHLESIEFNNCLFITNVTVSLPTYTANATYTNVAVTSSTLMHGNNTEEFTTLYNVTYDNSDFSLTSAGWENTGTPYDAESGPTNIGVYGGRYAWRK